MVGKIPRPGARLRRAARAMCAKACALIALRRAPIVRPEKIHRVGFRGVHPGASFPRVTIASTADPHFGGTHVKRIRTAIAAAAAACCLAAPAFAQTDFYKGKTVYLWIGEAAGGDYDTWGRLVAQHIKNHLPGNPTIVAQNVEGAGGLTAINRIAHIAPKDGTVFGDVNRGLPFEPLLGGKGALFDPRTLTWIGSPELDVIVCTARKDAPVKTLQDLKTKELIVGATGSGADSLTYPQFLQGLL